MSEKNKVFEARVTLGELLAVISLIGGLLTFSMKYEARVVALEINHNTTTKRLDKLEQLIEKTEDNHAALVELLQRMRRQQP